MSVRSASAFGVVSQWGERLNGIQKVRGSIPLSSTIFFGGIAQLGERNVRNVEVGSSILPISTS